MINIIPKPNSLKENKGKKKLSKASKIVIDSELIEIKSTLLKEFKLFNESNIVSGENGKDIHFSFDNTLKNESYKIFCDEQTLLISAAGFAGAFYAVQSLKQMLFFDLAENKAEIEIPCVEIFDEPRYKHRGVQIDESRHFFGKDAIKRVIDLMAFYKLNVLHWHLTDDQGWRIEIKKYPLLTQIGAFREDSAINGWNQCEKEGKPHGGFYTHEDIREVIKYALERNITINPEVDMPAHFSAAFAAYPWLSCSGEKTTVPWHFGGKTPVMAGLDKDWFKSACMGKETTFEFVFAIIDELAELFPSKYIHIGGDEAPVADWEKCPNCKKLMEEKGIKNGHDLQGYFTNIVNDYAKTKGKNIIVWNEALAAVKLDNTVIGQYWTEHTDKNVIRHMENGGKIIISKHQSFYFDMCYCQYPLTNTYNFNPTEKMISENLASQVLGMEGVIWTEWIPTIEKLDLQLFPRMEALSEICWTEPKNKNLNDFKKRLKNDEKILTSLGVNYAEDEISMPKGKFRRLRETNTWYQKNQDRELERNREIKKKR
ncbi:MAG: beta-N-acetylhexosaminidase [Oscillospiraceae bacterium]